MSKTKRDAIFALAVLWGVTAIVTGAFGAVAIYHDLHMQVGLAALFTGLALFHALLNILAGNFLVAAVTAKDVS